MSRIEDFKDAKLWTLETTLRERYDEKVDYQLADSEIRLRPTDWELSTCPVPYREAGACHFVIVKTGNRRYRCPFYYRLHEQFGTGVDEYNDLSECAVSLLQAQAGHERARPEPGSRVRLNAQRPNSRSANGPGRAPSNHRRVPAPAGDNGRGDLTSRPTITFEIRAVSASPRLLRLWHARK